jgi:hypothetical protein
MRILFKIIVAPFVAILTLVVAILNFFFMLSSWVFVLLSFFLGIAGIIMLATHGPVYNSVGLIVMGFLISPFGLPAIGEWIVGKLDDLNYSLRDFITS